MAVSRPARLPHLVITPGEPAGVGPDLIIRIAREEWAAALTVVADPQLLRDRAALLGEPLHFIEAAPGRSPSAHRAGSLVVHPVPLHAPVTAGVLSSRNGPYVIETLRVATDECLTGRADALVTGPVHKGIINDAGIAFTGHTEFLAEQTQAPLPVMMLVAGGLRVALATTHLPLRAVAEAITAPLLEQVLRILHRELVSRFGIASPNILVCGLNPHAGEGGHLGREEIDLIIPVLARLRDEGMRLEGPLPADTVFVPHHLQRADAVLAMYHDQGLPVLKRVGFGSAVNITLGLPMIRTSVDHGTALDLAGKGLADGGSLRAALSSAIDLVRHTADASCNA